MIVVYRAHLILFFLNTEARKHTDSNSEDSCQCLRIMCQNPKTGNYFRHFMREETEKRY